MRFTCGIFFGLLIALTIYYFCVIRRNPDLHKQSIEQIEQTWDNAKKTGDLAVDTIKKDVP